MNKATIVGMETGELSIAQKLKNEILMLDARWRVTAGRDPVITIYVGRMDALKLEADCRATEFMGAGIYCDIASGKARFMGKPVVPVNLENYFKIEANVEI